MAQGKNAPPRPSQGPPSACQHPHLQFKNGGLVQCCTCPVKFGALDPNNEYMVDIFARTKVPPLEDHRSSPSAPPHKH